ncbi:biotin-dependent carboxyltransferase family protein [Bacillus sp. V59.32b]|uniref:5-oxoprolinase subunit C family protein n=1 Tax=Bacillus sp. V59.32b TaxID=1758642 RepID=UPI000E3D9064|nr:biotin-dependent carboxyltransferase family protein [Bacillus sp. V59.32b]RFU64341.1 biotin-dependent carboxyltransferase family protein [Bacillus sp. V59.32b]
MLTITKPGLLTSIQDLGRYGFQKFGVIASGVMDPLSHRIANLLVGNQESAPTMEITLIGPAIEFKEDALISICGGDLSPVIDGKPVRMWRSVFVKKGSTLQFGKCRSGCRAYLALAGGYAVKSIMGSKSTYLRAEMGGFNGRALQAGDQVSFKPPGDLSAKIIQYIKKDLSPDTFVQSEWSVASDLIPNHANSTSIRVIKGLQFDLFTEESQDTLFKDLFEISSQSDRMGYRLKGPTLSLDTPQEMISEAVNFGTIQVPSDGNPIILLADRQTTGGYPKIGQVTTVDLPLLAQAKPGDRIRFAELSHEDAESLYLERETQIKRLRMGIALKFR